MSKIGEKIFYNLKEKYKTGEDFKILFCPYKETMYDSMKTIVDTALLDNETCVSVMPIPYFTLQNNAPYESRMEFAELKDNFPTALNNDWDCIVFHYPYDLQNNLTRPMLFSSELKRFCKHLVLVFYGCRGDREVREDEVLLTGVLNSDLIVYETQAQADRATEIIKTYYPNWNGENVAWGTAKTDCLLDCKDEKVILDYKNIIKGRKVILLQTSIVPLLNDNNKIDNIETIINKYIKDDSVCLIWRPHPLYRDTLIAHRPQFLEQYDALVERFKKSKKDILDISKYPQSVISIADEMISDMSSLVVMWKQLKPSNKLTMF